jgi:hypothetical protein
LLALGSLAAAVLVALLSVCFVTGSPGCVRRSWPRLNMIHTIP